MLVTWDLGRSVATAHPAREATDGRSSLRVVLDAAGRLRERLREAMGPLGLGYPAYRILELVRESGSGIDAVELARARRSTLASTMEVLEELARDGCVRLVTDLGRGGAIVARPTRRGEQRASECGRRLEAVLADFRGALGPHETARLERLLARVDGDAA